MKDLVNTPTVMSPITDEKYVDGVIAVDEHGRDINRLILNAIIEQNSLIATLNGTIADLVEALPGGGRVMRTKRLF